MTKQAFLAAVEARLQGVSPSDIQKSLDFYREMIDDRIEEGMSEAEAVAAMGSPEEAARQILSEMPLPKVIKAKADPGRSLHGWEIALLIIGSPVWVPLLLAAFVIFFAVYVVIWSVVIAFFAVDVAFAGCAIAFIPGGIIASVSAGGGVLVLLLGLACIFAALTILWFFVCLGLSKAMVKLSVLIIRGIKSLFIGRSKKA